MKIKISKLKPNESNPGIAPSVPNTPLAILPGNVFGGWLAPYVESIS